MALELIEETEWHRRVHRRESGTGECTGERVAQESEQKGVWHRRLHRWESVTGTYTGRRVALALTHDGEQYWHSCRRKSDI